MKWIRKMLGIDELIKEQKETNKLLYDVIRILKWQIDNDCSTHEHKRRYMY